MKTDYLKSWEEATNRLVGQFVLKYFTFADVFWIAEEVGGVLVVNDYFFDLNFIVDAMRHKASKKKMFEYYEYQMKAHSEGKKPDINFKNYLKHGTTKK